MFIKDRSGCCTRDRLMEGRGGRQGGQLGGWTVGRGRGVGEAKNPAAHTCRASPLDSFQSHFSGNSTLDLSGSPEDGQGRSYPVSR